MGHGRRVGAGGLREVAGVSALAAGEQAGVEAILPPTVR